MKVNGHECDVCEVFARKPDDWFKVTRRKAVVEICSPKCLKKLGTQLETGDILISDEGADPSEEWKCPLCDRTFAKQQGLSMHMTRTHKERQQQ